MANKKTGRAKPLAAKAGLTRDSKRRYCGGGKLAKGKSFKCGGKLSK